MSEHDKLARAGEALTETIPMACGGNAHAPRFWIEQYGLVVLAAPDGHADGLEAARREGARDMLRKVWPLVKNLDMQTAPAEGWEGRLMRVKERLAAIRKLAEREVRTPRTPNLSAASPRSWRGCERT